MDRPIINSGQVPRTIDHLNGWKMAMVGMGRLMLDLFGPGTYVGGLPCTQTAVASMAVLVGPGAVYALESVDTTAYSIISADTANQIVKQGLLLSPGSTLTTPAPTSAGQSINYLIQATYQDSDTTPIVLAYYNSANPAVPFSGPNNNNTAQATIRAGQCIVQAKAGNAATTGTQTTPSPDSGFVGLYVVTVPYGATSITAANISTVVGAPFLSTQLTGVLAAIQAQAGNYAADTGAANALVATLSPAVTSLKAGLTVRILVANTNTAASTLNLNGLGAKAIVNPDGTPLTVRQLIAGAVAELVYDGTSFELQTSAGFRPGFSRVVNFTTPGSGTYTVPAGVYALKVRGVGAGGAGGGCNGTYSGASGGAGGYFEGVMSVVPGQTISYAVGAGGAGAAAGTIGGSGGSTSFGSFSATGGTGGASNSGSAPGGAPGVGSGATINLSGGYGNDSPTSGAGSVLLPGGPGGSSAFGGGGRSAGGGGSPANGTAPGSGGGGAYQTSAMGGSGAPGMIIVEY